MITVIETSKDKKGLHYLEFVKPVLDILKDEKTEVMHYLDIPSDIKDSGRIIICGNGLQDSEFLNHLDRFSFLKGFKGSVLGICAGMQIISIVNGGKIVKKERIGQFKAEAKVGAEDFLPEMDGKNIYELHNLSCSLPNGFEKIAVNDKKELIAFRKGKVYGVLFHPEVMNKEIVRKFSEW